MDSVEIILTDGTKKLVNGIFYVYNSKFYFMYTKGELDSEDYIKLNLVQVSKEVSNTPSGPIETGYMIGTEISDKDEWKNVQQSIQKIVEDKKNNTQNSEIQYLPISMLVNLKVLSENKFKLLRSIIENNFKVQVNIEQPLEVQNVAPINPLVETVENNVAPIQNDENSDSVVIDYRTKFFEEQEKNKSLEEEINNLKEKIENIRKVIE